MIRQNALVRRLREDIALLAREKPPVVAYPHAVRVPIIFPHPVDTGKLRVVAVQVRYVVAGIISRIPEVLRRIFMSDMERYVHGIAGNIKFFMCHCKDLN